jgi:hypothetical protein
VGAGFAGALEGSVTIKDGARKRQKINSSDNERGDYESVSESHRDLPKYLQPHPSF